MPVVVPQPRTQSEQRTSDNPVSAMRRALKPNNTPLAIESTAADQFPILGLELPQPVSILSFRRNNQQKC